MFLVICLLVFSIGLALLGCLLVDSESDIEEFLVFWGMDRVDASLTAERLIRVGWGATMLAPALYCASFAQLGRINYERLVILWTHVESMLLFSFFFIGILGCAFWSHWRVRSRAR